MSAISSLPYLDDTHLDTPCKIEPKQSLLHRARNHVRAASLMLLGLIVLSISIVAGLDNDDV